MLLRRVANVFVPLVPALIGSGVIAGIGGLLTSLHWLPALVPALVALSSGFLSLIAVFVGYQTAKEFGGTPILGGAAAGVIVFAGVSHVSVFGQRLAAGQGVCWAPWARRRSRPGWSGGAAGGCPRHWTPWSRRR